jgi:hypothetical protein
MAWKPLRYEPSFMKLTFGSEGLLLCQLFIE